MCLELMLEMVHFEISILDDCQNSVALDIKFDSKWGLQDIKILRNYVNSKGSGLRLEMKMCFSVNHEQEILDKSL